MIRGVHHVAIVVDDLDAMLAFYTGTLGFEEAASISWEAGTDLVDEIIGLDGSAADVRILRAGNAYLELFCFRVPDGHAGDGGSSADRGIRHAALDVTDIDAEYERLRAAGVRFFSAPREVEVAGHPLKTAYFRDPEGNIMELQELLQGDDSALALPVR